MSKTYISTDLRKLVIERAGLKCEYCLIHEDDSHYGHQVDHIISEKHGGQTTEDNLALACIFCNRAKGSDIGSIIFETNTFVRLFNPRKDIWQEHFTLDGTEIHSRTDIATVTIRLLDLNALERLLERKLLVSLGRYP